MPALDQEPFLEPRPFCGNNLEANWTRKNPSARCRTPDCFGTSMPVVILDYAESINRWNTRVARQQQPELAGQAAQQLRQQRSRLLDAPKDCAAVCAWERLSKSDLVNALEKTKSAITDVTQSVERENFRQS